MARTRTSDLRRRRGTGRRSRRSSSYRLGLQLLICFALVVGMTTGVVLYLLYSLVFDESTVSTSGETRGSLRKHKHVKSPHELIDQLIEDGIGIADDIGKHHHKNDDSERIDDTERDDDANHYIGKENLDKSSERRAKAEFMNHKVKIGTSGAFPYYPATPLVAKDHDFKSFQPMGGKRFEEYKHGDSPYTYSSGESDELARSRLYHVKKAMQHAWAGYEKYAFGMDELKPVSMTGDKNWGGIGTTLVDSLDTLWLMDMKEEFYRARDWCKNKLNHDIDKDVSVFETTIRSLGGLLSAYDWSQDKVFLDQAKDLGKRLFQSLNTKSGIPMSIVNLHNGEFGNQKWARGSTNIAEVGTLQIEFRALARFSGIGEYKSRTEKIFKLLEDLNVPDGLYPSTIRNRKLLPQLTKVQQITFGARADSFYEYMLKIWLQGGQTETHYREMYDKSIQGMHDVLLTVAEPSELVFIADKNMKGMESRMDYKMDHLVCFMGGLLALGAYTDPQGLESERAQRDLKTAKALTYTCYQMYARMPTGLSPEYVQFQHGKDFGPGKGGHHFLLRPEAVESFFVLYQLTGDPIYREWGWEVFQAIERFCKTTAGYGKVKNVRNTDRPPEDKMESFFLAETLKYLYLLFDPDTPIDILHKHVFNTEAHPLRIFPVMDEEGVPDLLKEE